MPSTYLVGGTLRNIILGLPVKDYDFCVDLNWNDLNLYAEKLGTVLVAHKETSTLKVRHQNLGIIDLASPMSRFGYDGRKPSKSVYDTLENDSKRRDLTINGLYYQVHLDAVTTKNQIELVNTRYIIDYVNGLSDIDQKLVRFIGSPKERCKEDSLRAFRAVRFAVQLPEFEIEPDDTYSFLESYSYLHFQNLNGNRIRDELNLMLKADRYKAFKMFLRFRFLLEHPDITIIPKYVAVTD